MSYINPGGFPPATTGPAGSPLQAKTLFISGGVTADTLVRSGAGFLFSIIVPSPGTNAGTQVVFDNVVSGGRQCAGLPTNTPVGTYTFNCPITSGILIQGQANAASLMVIFF